MRARSAFNNNPLFEEKYDLYGDMLYRLGIIYFGVGNDNQICQEAINEAFLWLFTRKKSFKNSGKEKLELIRRMVLICKSKSKKRAISIPEIEDETSENAFCSESIDMLESAYGLPLKYRPVIHLALYENLDMRHISKILSIPRPIVKKLHAKGMELMEMVLERKLDREYYHSMLDEYQTPSDIKEEVYLYLTEGKPHVKAYLSPLQKSVAVLAAIAAAALFMTVIRFYPVISPIIRTKYAFMNGTIRSVTLSSIYESNVPGVLFAYFENGYQGYTLNGGSLEQLETKHITKTIDYAGQQFEVNFYYCIKDGRLAVKDNAGSNDTGSAYIYPQDGSTNSVLVILYHYDMENIENRENGVNTFIYPLIMNINTFNTTDFILDCGISDFDHVIDINLNDHRPGAIVITEDNSMYYCNIKSSSIIEIANYGDNQLSSVCFCNNETVLYSIINYKALETGYETSYYEYSTSTNTVKKCYEFDSASGKKPIGDYTNTVLLKNSDNTYSIVDIRTGASSNIPNMKEEDSLNLLTRYSPDGRHILFEYNTYRMDGYEELKRIYIYDRETRKTSILNLKDYKDVYFTGSFWYDKDHIALWKGDSEPINNNTPSPETEHPSTLWIFDINKLK